MRSVIQDNTSSVHNPGKDIQIDGEYMKTYNFIDNYANIYKYQLTVINFFIPPLSHYF